MSYDLHDFHAPEREARILYEVGRLDQRERQRLRDADYAGEWDERDDTVMADRRAKRAAAMLEREVIE
jgi:hypothetical protein